jgi:RimJ/RimL family protein N-acetyltransferase
LLSELWSKNANGGSERVSCVVTRRRNRVHDAGCLVAIDAARRSIIGCSRYSNYAPGERITIGYTFLARSHWGGAANAEMKRLMLRHAFTDVQEVLFTIAERNVRSRRAVEKLGAELTEAEGAPRWGQIHVTYRLTPQVWATRLSSTSIHGGHLPFNCVYVQ